MIPLFVIRHGPTAWNADKRLQGKNDLPLSPTGRKTVAAWRIPPEYADFQWVSSPLGRALETAEILGFQCVPEPALEEMSWGRWEGLRFADLKRELGDTMIRNQARGLDFRPDGGESPREVQRRLKPWLASLDRPTAAVCHKGIIQAIYAAAVGWDMIGKPPTKLCDAMGHLFSVTNGAPAVSRLNIPLEPA